MSYCINPKCSHRQNPDDLENCRTCGTRLLINERYKILQPLRVGQAYNSEVFEVKDLSERGTSKVLKSLQSNNSKLIELFEKEAQVLIWLSTDWQRHPGIPKVKPDGYFEFSVTQSFRKLKCLVMEKIEGKNLLEWVEQHQPISQEQALNWLKQLVEILDKVHCQGLWHRDIKPSNIMLKPDGQLVLIDFGSVGIGETRIVSFEYTPQEQIEGRTVLQSDFFALGRTFVYLLTGKPPSEMPKTSRTEQLIWSSLAPDISRNLVHLIDDLMAPLPANRPQNTQAILQRIQALEQQPTPKKINHQSTPVSNSEAIEVTQIHGNNSSIQPSTLIKFLGALILGLSGIIIYNLLPCPLFGNFKSCSTLSPNKLNPSISSNNFNSPKSNSLLDSLAVGDKLSIGEELLVPSSSSLEKQQGVEAFREGEYGRAVNLLKAAQNKSINDPETLIYLNNARIEAEKAQAYTIAVAAPLNNQSDDILNSGLEVLRGIAQAQNEINQNNKINGISLRVIIVDDNNDIDQANKMAKQLVARPEVLAVVGHFSSDVTLDVINTYQNSPLLLVSPTSSSDEFTNKKSAGSANFFFRIVSSDRVTAQALASYLLNQVRQQQVAVFYNARSHYSASLRDQFNIIFNSGGGQIIKEVDFSTAAFSANVAINQAQQQGAKALILLPDSTTRAKALEVMKANQHRLFMVGGDSVYNASILQKGDRHVAGLVVATPWDSLSSPNPDFPQNAKQLWGGAVSWRTALTYDAARVLITALETTPNPSRTRLQQTLSNSNFQATGATGIIRFRSNGDRQESQIQLVQVALDQQGRLEFSRVKRSQK